MASSQIYISGMYSGPSPSAGLGVARCLRAGFPAAHLVGVDHWNGSSGLHHEVLNERVLLPSWDNIDRAEYVARVEKVLAAGGVWISSHDIEVDFLGRNVAPHPRLLAPLASSFSLTAKPHIQVKELLPFPVPAQISTRQNDAALYAFCREHSWRVWLKGPYHEAHPVTNWRDFETARAGMHRQWKEGELVLQAHVRGYEESICFAAAQGELLDLVVMEKRVTTAEGKTWSGSVRTASDELTAVIRSVAKKIAWNGGAEIELIRDADGKCWLMEWNPRFPAWIYGACLAGKNLPALLVARALGEKVAPQITAPNAEFTRVVVEIPVSPELRLPLPAEPLGLVTAGKYGAGLSLLAKSLSVKTENSPRSEAPHVDPLLLGELRDSLRPNAPTPERILLPKVAGHYFERISGLTRRASHPACKFTPAYSFKTSPDKAYIDLARKNGFAAECISQLEVQRALQSGYRAEEIILNGPGKWWPQELKSPRGLKALFCDSVLELEQVVNMADPAHTVGVRIRVPSVQSRFGIPLGDFSVFNQVVTLLAQLPASVHIGVHFHMASSAIGIQRWFDALAGSLSLAGALEKATGRPIRVADLGGGWLREDFESIDLEHLRVQVESHLPHVREILVEPGKALTQETMVLRTRVLDVRRESDRVEDVVVDACIAELPLSVYFPHRVCWKRANSTELVPLRFGTQRVLGRICMEDDLLSRNIELPLNIAQGDELLFLDAGAYERTMAYEFGRGGL